MAFVESGKTGKSGSETRKPESGSRNLEAMAAARQLSTRLVGDSHKIREKYAIQAGKTGTLSASSR
jgi:hypothetical protein